MSKIFGEILKEARKQKGLTQIEVCEATGIEQAIYSRLETGKRKMLYVEEIKKICKFLRIDANQLFGLNSVDVIDLRVDRGIGYKQKIISQLKNCIEAIKETKSQSLIKLAEEIVINEDEDTIRIAYQHKKDFLFRKDDSLNLIPLCCITSLFLNEVLKVTEEEISEAAFDPQLIPLYVQCEDILNDIFSK